jgi:hypothetical protein
VDEISAAITESIADLPGSDADLSVDTSTDTSTDTTEVASTEPEQPAETTEVEAPAPKPVSRSQARIQQLANERKALEDKFNAERQTWDQERESLSWARDPNAKLLFDGLSLMERDPKTFVENVLLKDERYAGLIALKQAQDAAIAESQARGTEEQEPEFPPPDLQYADGSPAHSPEAIAKYVRDVANYAAKAASKPYEEKIAALEQRLSPFEKEVRDRQMYGSALEKQTQAWERAAKVYGLTNGDKQDIHAWMKGEWAKGRKVGISDAMEEYVVPRIVRERDEAHAASLKAADTERAQRVAAGNAEAAAAERAPVGAAGRSDGSGDPIEDAIRAAIKNLPDR